MAGSNSARVFAEACENLLEKLGRDQQQTAQVLRARLTDLSKIFNGFATREPEPRERTAALNQLLDLNREVLMYLSKPRAGSTGR
jgi:hypothetical protein